MCISSQPWVHEWQMQMHLPFCFNREKHLLQRTIILTYFFHTLLTVGCQHLQIILQSFNPNQKQTYKTYIQYVYFIYLLNPSVCIRPYSI